jgi:hypothetical protein
MRAELPAGTVKKLLQDKARLEGFEPPTRCQEGSWIAILIDVD